MERNKVGYIILAASLVAVAVAYLLPASLNQTTITIAGYEYQPENISIKEGTTIRWINYDLVQHDVISGVPGIKEDLFAAPLLAYGQGMSFTFEDAGEFRYFCGIHPYMTGMIIVESAP